MSQVLHGGNSLGCHLQNMFNSWASRLRDLREIGISEVRQVPKSVVAGIMRRYETAMRRPPRIALPAVMLEADGLELMEI